MTYCTSAQDVAQGKKVKERSGLTQSEFKIIVCSTGENTILILIQF